MRFGNRGLVAVMLGGNGRGMMTSIAIATTPELSISSEGAVLTIGTPDLWVPGTTILRSRHVAVQCENQTPSVKIGNASEVIDRMEVRGGIEPPYADLQSAASPLCHRTAGAGLD